MLLASRSAAGGDLPALETTSTSLVGWRFDNENASACDDDYGEARERLNLSSHRGPWAAGLRLDAEFYHETPSPPGCPENQLADRYENRISPEKAWLSWTGRTLGVTAGDAYVSVGRGLVLSLRKLDELGQDTTLRGAKALYDDGRFRLMAAGGYINIGNVDEASGLSVEDPMDLVGAAAVNVLVRRGISLGAHGAYLAFKQPTVPIPSPEDYEETWLLLGPALDAPRILPWLGIYAEGVAQRRSPIRGEPDTGFGLYALATASFRATTLILEGKAYGDLAPVMPHFAAPEFRAIQYASPPTVERVLQPLEHPQRDVVGGRLRVDRILTPTLSAYGSLGLIRDHEGYLVASPGSGARSVPGTILAPYLGIDFRFHQARSRALVEAGWRLVVADETHDWVRSDAHLDVDLAVAACPALSIELHGSHLKRAKEEPLLEKDWSEGTLQLGLKWRSHLHVAAVWDYTSEPKQPAGNVHLFEPILETLAGDRATIEDYLSGVVRWDVSTSSSVQLAAGASRGGLKCVSGVCRVYPPFEGLRLMATLRF